jgi:hypothetical protein
MSSRPPRRTIANLLLLCGALLLLVGTLTVLGNALSSKPLLLPGDTLLAGVVLVAAGSALLRTAALAAEVLLSAVGLPLLLFGVGLGLRALQGRPGSLVLAALMIASGIIACYGARQLMLRRLRQRTTGSRIQG